jgi:hypothetical protein
MSKYIEYTPALAARLQTAAGSTGSSLPPPSPFVLVSDESTTTTVPQRLALDQPVLAEIPTARAGRKLAGKIKNLAVTLRGIPQQFVGAVATGLTVNYDAPFNPTDFPEITQFGAIYDEARIRAVKVHYKLFCSTSATTPVITYGSFAVQFDTRLANYSTTYGALESQFNSGLNTVWTSTSIDQDMTARLRTITAVPDKLAVISAVDPPGSSWFVISALPNAFNLAGFAASPGAAGVLTLMYYPELEVEFRVRY